MALNAKSYLRCRALVPGCATPKVDAPFTSADSQARKYTIRVRETR